MRSLDDIGVLVAAVHAQPTPSRLHARGTDDPQSWVATSRRSPTSHLPAIEQTAADLPPVEARADVVVHGDLHDKNIFCDAARLALIDLDGLGLGAPEDDIANLAVHLELRNLQARTGLLIGARSRALYRSYRRIRPLDPERLRAVERHTWFRLACLYQYRAASAHLVPLLLGAAGGRSGQHHRHLTPTERTRADLK
jgi:Ser/Thr protein kinase RdoA (MazF antagonist)